MMYAQTAKKGPDGTSAPKLQVHDVAVSYLTPYPYDLNPELSLTVAMESIKGTNQFIEMKEILCKTYSGRTVFINLFWLFFSLRFQPLVFPDVVEKYKQEIKENYANVFYALHTPDTIEVTGKLRRIPIVYAWAIIKTFHSVFKKSTAEYTAKFIAKCCQITIYELTGLYVTEAFVQHELKIIIQDPLLFDYFPQ